MKREMFEVFRCWHAIGRVLCCFWVDRSFVLSRSKADQHVNP